jgi:hypothetical protein
VIRVLTVILLIAVAAILCALEPAVQASLERGCARRHFED